MYHKHHTKGIVVYGLTEGDDSRRVWIFTEDFGLLSAKAQGARKSISRLRPSVQDLSFGTFSLIKGKTGWKIVSINVENNFYEDLKFSKDRLSIAINIFNFVNKNIGVEEENRVLFEMVINFMRLLKTLDEKKVPLAECLIMLRIIHNLGFLKNDPEISLYLPTSIMSDDELENIAPKKKKIIDLINDSMRSADLTR